MSKPQTTTDSPELIKLRLQAQQAEIKERQALLTDFLDTIKKMMKDQAALYLPTTLGDTQRSVITKPQVFLSYAWEADGTPKLTHLHTFLKQLAADLTAAGLIPWLDLQKMTGDLDEQMRNGIQKSQYVLLIGTNRYAERTQPGSKTNVRKELEFTLDEGKKSADFLLPLMLEGDYGTTFPTVGKYLIRNCRSWYSLEQGQWQNYIQELTQYEPLGVLPCLLGLNRHDDYPKYRQACLKGYKQHQQSLMAKLKLRQLQSDDNKQGQNRPVIQLTPVLQIPFQTLEYDKKADKIGSGSYGEVYRGQWQGQQANQIVAIKELTGTLTAEAEKDLYREVGIMAHLAKVSKEPHYTVRLFGLAVNKPDFALVMEYVPNGTLFALLQHQTELPWDLRYQLAADIADGIDLLHRQHILHRDLRSHNVLLYILEGRLRAKLSDFGLSTVKNSVRTTTTKTTTNSAGTLAWMAPELHNPDGHSSAASEIYSYGVTLWELVTREIPFKNASSPYFIPGWVSSGITNKIPDNCPPKLAELIKKCWAFKPEDRIQIAEIQKELAILVKANPLSPETQAIVETLKKTQMEREEKWNVRWQKKLQDIEQKQTERWREVEIKKQAEIARLQQQYQAEQLALQKQMEQLQLNQEKQKQELEIQKKVAVEEKRRLATEKQAEIERIKQQHQAELTELKRTPKELKYETTPVQPPKSAPPLPTISQTKGKRFISELKPKASPEQLALQDQLIAACKQGDEKGVKVLLNQGAKPDMANAKDEQPLGAAVWGMCPDVVNALLKQAGNVALMTWEECKTHNQKFYNEVFIVPIFAPQTYGEWYQLLQKIDPNPFIRDYHLKMADDLWHNKESASWVNYVASLRRALHITRQFELHELAIAVVTEKMFVGFRTQIKQGIETAKQPIKLAQENMKYETPIQPPKPTSPVSQITTPRLMPPPKPKASPAQLALQDQLIAACKQGDEKTVTALLIRGARPDIANAKSEHPLGAAVWGMCPDVVNALLKQAGGVAPMTWQQCEKHNLEHYKEVFIIPKFDPRTFGEWNTLLQKMDPNPFIRAFHLKKIDEQTPGDHTSSWDNLKTFVGMGAMVVGNDPRLRERIQMNETETGFVSYRSRIKQGIETAKQPTMALHF